MPILKARPGPQGFGTRLQWVSLVTRTLLLGAHTCAPVRASVLTLTLRKQTVMGGLSHLGLSYPKHAQNKKK